MRRPRSFSGGLRSVDGSAWIVGRDHWQENPRHRVPTVFFHVVRLWLRCRGDAGGLVALPETGGMNAQPAWLVAAFDVLAGCEAEARTVTESAGAA